MEIHAAFTVLKETPSFIYIKDTGHKNTITITNDAEYVVRELDTEYKSIEGPRIFYMDSDGRIDEIIHRGSRFIGFKAGHKGVEL